VNHLNGSGLCRTKTALAGGGLDKALLACLGDIEFLGTGRKNPINFGHKAPTPKLRVQHPAGKDPISTGSTPSSFLTSDERCPTS
jgi:hypothetical protein